MQNTISQKYYFSPIELEQTDIHNPFEACQIRAKVYANACIYVLLRNQNQDFVPILKIVETTKAFVAHLKFCNLKQQKLQFKLGQYTLVQELQELLKNFQHISKLSLNDILLGEAFWYWDVMQPSILLSSCRIQLDANYVIEIQQKDSPIYYPLTKKQLSKWQQIIENKKPKWFLNLPHWAQITLLTAGDKLTRIMPITFRGLPGLANTGQHQLHINNSKLTPSDVFRMAVPVPYLMEDSQERLSSTIDNIDQMLAYWLKDERVSEFIKKYWGYSNDSLLAKVIKKPMLIFSLLTGNGKANYLGKIVDTLGFSINSNNISLVADSNECYARFFNQHPQQKKNFDIFVHDLGINLFRSHKAIIFDKDFLIFLEEFLQTLRQHQSDIPRENRKKIHALQAILSTIKRHAEIIDSELTKGRNKNLYLAALYDLAIRLTGGVFIGNCKSSKDRKGIELLYADAMLIFYYIHGVFPAYADQGKARQNFLVICKALFDSGHILKFINQHLIGCPGLKDEGIIDADLKDFLGENYKQAKLIANLSEPFTFLEKYRTIIFKTLLILAVIECTVLGLLWFFHWLPPLNFAMVLSYDPVITSFLALVTLNLMLGIVLKMLFNYANFKQKGESLDEIIEASENNAQSHDKYQKPACISSYNCL